MADTLSTVLRIMRKIPTHYIVEMEPMETIIEELKAALACLALQGQYDGEPIDVNSKQSTARFALLCGLTFMDVLDGLRIGETLVDAKSEEVLDQDRIAKLTAVVNFIKEYDESCGE